MLSSRAGLRQTQAPSWKRIDWTSDGTSSRDLSQWIKHTNSNCRGCSADSLTAYMHYISGCGKLHSLQRHVDKLYTSKQFLFKRHNDILQQIFLAFHCRPNRFRRRRYQFHEHLPQSLSDLYFCYSRCNIDFNYRHPYQYRHVFDHWVPSRR